MSVREVNAIRRLRMNTTVFFRLLLSCIFVVSLLISHDGIVHAASLQPGEQPGVSLGAMRLIYPSASKSVTLTLTNNTDQTWLAQSAIKTVDFATGEPGNVSGPFVITPPLTRLGPWQKMPVRVIYTGGELPGDRESVFYITVRMIPQVTADERNDGGSLNIGLINDIKLFYRPSSLAGEGGMAAAGKKITVRTDGGDVIFTNPTPYYISLDNLTVNGSPVDDREIHRMIPPKGKQTYPVPEGIPVSGKKSLHWSVIDELGNRIPGMAG